MLLHTLVAGHSEAATRRLHRLFDQDDVRCSQVPPQDDLLEATVQQTPDLLAIELERLGQDPEASLATLRDQAHGPEVVVLTSGGDPSLRTRLLAAQAFAVLDQEASDEELMRAAAGLSERRALRAQDHLRASLSEPRADFGDYATKSPAMREFLAFARKVVGADSTLLIHGETGTGKEHLARAIHRAGDRASGPFVPVNAAALSESLLESELFGHVAGAFTGAQKARRGYFELAHGGVLFLDEVGELPPSVQVKLLRTLQDKVIVPVGSEQPIQVNVRLIAATHRDLPAEVAAGRFRADLYYRLSVVPLFVPSLRDRPEDIPDLFCSQVEDHGIRLRRPARTVSPEALQCLAAYPWPGNVRELINVAERAALLCEGAEVGPADLPRAIRGGPSPQPGSDQGDLGPAPKSGPLTPEQLGLPFREACSQALANAERQYLRHLLGSCHGRLADAAKTARLAPRTLYEAMRRHGLRKEDFRLT